MNFRRQKTSTEYPVRLFYLYNITVIARKRGFKKVWKIKNLIPSRYHLGDVMIKNDILVINRIAILVILLINLQAETVFQMIL